MSITDAAESAARLAKCEELDRLPSGSGIRVVYGGDAEGPSRDRNALALEMRKWLDPAPVDESFARSVASSSRDGWHSVGNGHVIQLVECQGGGFMMLVVNASVKKPTIGQFWVACWLFNVEVTQA